MFEIGAAIGNDLALFQREGWHIEGCEPSARACANVEQRGIRLQNRPAEQANSSSVSAIVINNVLEHTHDPARILAACWSGLIPGGSLLIIVPHHNSWTARFFGSSWVGYDAPRHFWGFTPQSFSAAIERAGFAPNHHLVSRSLGVADNLVGRPVC